MSDRVFLVIVKGPKMNVSDADAVLTEMKELTGSANGVLVGETRANIPVPSPSHYIRGGKIEELRIATQETKANVLIFSVDLSPVQARNIENEIPWVRVVDRTGLILDIFARRAVSKDGKLQVELAQLQYLLPRLAGKGVIMSRLGGGIGTRGPGEQKLEVDRRKIRNRIEHIKGQIEKLSRHRALVREGRKQKRLRQIAIVGYTNAGKSTLLNALTGADAYVEDRLFATLDPKTRVREEKNESPILFTDTVGFIRDLPHGLVKAFHATLEEAVEADLVLIVVDAADELALEHKHVVDGVLKELGAESRPKLIALNKLDLLNDQQKARVMDLFPGACPISAVQKQGLRELVREARKLIELGEELKLSGHQNGDENNSGNR
ncbi:MAG: GTPase HflX [Candidatus Omnitrophica bacterium ADurb.Bin277]|nr:MAG: GTPase HflX [Candidatus Omnitrophica bacterium ADurb.Bin277]